MDYLENYHYWLNTNLPPEVKQELLSIQNNDDEIKSRFSADLQFGTAGMRGVMGAGSNRLNRYTVRRAAQGMAAWLASTDLPQSAAIGYDSRHYSAEFAEICAVALAEAFGCGVNDLPLSMVLSWYEQKAVCILLTLLHLGIKNIRLGPTLPAFISPNVLNFLVEKFNIAPISTPEADLQAILGR